MRHAPLPDRAVIEIGGPDWRGFLQGLLTQDVATLAADEIRFGALLTPQGRLLFDLFIVGLPEGCLLDCAAELRDALIGRLTIYRLRAKVEIAASTAPVAAAWGGEAPDGWLRDPRLPILGWRSYGAGAPAEAEGGDYDLHRLAAGAPGPTDWGYDETYPIEANFDLLAGIDFRKGCFVGQETTSRMKRRATVRTRLAPITFDGPAPAPGAELLAGGLRAGKLTSGVAGRAIASLRLDRLEVADRVLPDGRPWRPDLPPWMAA